MHQRAIRQLKIDEGLRLKPYKDSVGILTIGYGHNLEDKGIPIDIAEKLLLLDVSDVINDLNRVFPWYHEMEPARQDVFINMCFNLGLKKFMGFQKFLSACKQKNWTTAADEMMDSKWAKQVGIRAERLKEIMLKGKYD